MSTIGIVIMAACLLRGHAQQDAVPFTFEEWVWAAQGGYLDDMVAHYIRIGGL